MPFKEPFILGPFSVDTVGRLSLARQEVSPKFSVRWRGRNVRARLAQDEGQDIHLCIQAVLGRIPSTALDPVTRAECFDLFKNIPRVLPRSWSIQLQPDHQPRLEVITVVALPVTATNLVVELTAFLCILTPYLELLDQAGVRAIAPGTDQREQRQLRADLSN